MLISSVEYDDVNRLRSLCLSAFRATTGNSWPVMLAMPCLAVTALVISYYPRSPGTGMPLTPTNYFPPLSPHPRTLHHPEPTLTSFDKAGYLSLQRPPRLTWRPFPLFPQKWRVAYAEGRRCSVRVKRRTCNGKSRAWKKKESREINLLSGGHIKLDWWRGAATLQFDCRLESVLIRW